MQMFNTFIGVLCALVFLIFAYTVFQNYQEPLTVYLNNLIGISNADINR